MIKTSVWSPVLIHLYAVKSLKTHIFRRKSRDPAKPQVWHHCYTGP